jgi:hypothetical protein
MSEENEEFLYDVTIVMEDGRTIISKNLTPPMVQEVLGKYMLKCVGYGVMRVKDGEQ